MKDVTTGRVSPRPPWFAVSMLLLFAVMLTAVTVRNAIDALGRPFPSFMVDPYGFYSTLELPSWSLGDRPRPARVLAVEGVPLGPTIAYDNFPAQRMRTGLQAVAARGERSVSLTVLRQGNVVEERYPLYITGPLELFFFFGVYAISGWFVLSSGALVLLLAGQRLGGRVYAFWCAGTFSFLVTLFDYHTTMRLCPLFAVSTTWVALGFFGLAYAFPDLPKRQLKILRPAVTIGTVLLLVVAFIMVLLPAFGRSPRSMQTLITIPAALGLAMIVVGVLLRLRGAAEGRARAELVSTMWGLGIAPIFFAIVIILALTEQSGLFHLTLPFVIFAIPLSIGYALIRHNILATNAVLTRGMLVLPILAMGLLAALFAGLAVLRFMVGHGVMYVIPVAVGVAVFVAIVMAGQRAARRLFFSAVVEFRPTIEQLADQLASLRDRSAVRSAVRSATAWLGANDVTLLENRELAQIEHAPVDHILRLAEGELLWTLESPWQRRLLVPMRCLGELRAVLMVSPKRQAALYTSEDLSLLHTLASLGALALNTVDVLEEVERLRRLEVNIAQRDKKLTLGMFGAEMSHEIGYPLNYFRFLLKQVERGRALTDGEVEIGKEEVERLQRMLATLRKLTPPPIQVGPVRLLAPLGRAIDLLRELCHDKQIEIEVEIPDDLVIDAEHDPLLQLLANLLRNAVQAAGVGGRVGVRSFVNPQGFVLEVWDTGAGVPAEFASTLFDPWVTAREGGTGLGLAVTQRIVHGFGWTITFCREGDRTCFRVTIPSGSSGLRRVEGS